MCRTRSYISPSVGVGSLSVELTINWINKYSAVAEMGDRLAKVDIGRKLGAVLLIGGS